ncbi:hypothetical protein [Chitinophaga sp.]|uniref:hypothetical protein n=1 Tax=Chitinophaga sp. TaxID=1869181 RepID=UPI0025C63F39|nr:hypothetical protein [Chitinophaga sp.]
MHMQVRFVSMFGNGKLGIGDANFLQVLPCDGNDPGILRLFMGSKKGERFQAMRLKPFLISPESG